MDAADRKSPEELEVERARKQLRSWLPIALILGAAAAVGYASYQPGWLMYWVMRLF